MNERANNVDLIPGDYRAGQRLRKRGVAWVVIAVAVSFAISLVASTFGYKVVALEAQVRPLREQVETMQGWSEKLVPLASQLETARNRQLVVNRLLEEPFWSGLLSDLAAAASENIWLTEARLWKTTVIVAAEGDLEAASAAPREREEVLLAISGDASSNFEVIRFMTSMSESQHVSSLELQTSKVREESEGRPVVEFEVLGTVR